MKVIASVLLCLSIAGCTAEASSTGVDVSPTTDGVAPQSTEARLSTITNDTARQDSEITTIVRTAFVDEFANHPELDLDVWYFDPTTTPSALRLLVTVDPFQYTGEYLRSKVNVAILRNSNGQLLGSTSATVSTAYAGFPAGPVKTLEDFVLDAAAGHAASKVINLMASF